MDYVKEMKAKRTFCYWVANEIAEIWQRDQLMAKNRIKNWIIVEA